MNIAYTDTKITIGLEDNPLAAPGGEGTVYRVKDTGAFKNYCAKIYHPPKRTAARRDKIRFMIQHKPSLVTAANYVICWPMEMLFDTGNNFIGFLMPLAFTGSEKLYELTTPRIPPRLEEQWGKFDRTGLSGMEKRWKICVNIAIAIHSIHSTGKYVVVDYKPQNILITNEGQISITDVDSFQISDDGIVLFHAEVVTPEYSPPESDRLNPARSLISPSWDRFSLAISFYEVLFGIHPFAATGSGQYQTSVTISEKIKYGLFVHGSKKVYLSMIPPLHDNFKTLPPSLEQLFLKAFEDGYLDVNARPSAEQWGKTIHAELMTKTGIKPNTVTIPPRTGRTITSPTSPQGSSTTITTPQKKEDYMIWKILTAVLAFVVLILGINLGSANTDVSRLRNAQYESSSDMSALKTQVGNLQTALDALSGKYPITVTGISFSNEDLNGNKLTAETQTFDKNTLQYIHPIIKFNSNLRTATTYSIYFTYRNPNGELEYASNSPSGYSWYADVSVPGDYAQDQTADLSGMNFGGSGSTTGRYQVGIWCKGIQVGQSYFYVTE